MNKEMNTQKNAVTLFIIDQSGSMQTLKIATEESHQGVLQKIKQECQDLPELQQYLSTWVFGNGRVNEQMPLTKVGVEDSLKRLNLNCSGDTPLLDGIGKACTELERQMNRLKMSPENTLVTVAVFTDGEENSSREFSQPEVKRLITRLRENGWIFNYYGTDTSVEDMKENLAFDYGMNMNASAAGIQNSMIEYSEKSFADKKSWLGKR